MTQLRQGFVGQGDASKAVFLSYASQDARRRQGYGGQAPAAKKVTR